MKLTFEVHSEDNLLGDQAKRYYRAAAAFFLHAIGELEAADDVPTGTAADKTPETTHGGNVVIGNFPQAPPPPPPTLKMESATGSASTQAPPAPTSPMIPPPPPAATAMAPTTPPSVSTPSATAAPASSVSAASAEPPVYDKSGMPWDERIHQKGKNQKQDGTWKLKKLVKATPAEIAAFDVLVQQVVQEHAQARLVTQGSGMAPIAAHVASNPPPMLPEIAARIAALNANQYPVPPPPPPPPSVSLSPGGNGSVPVPPSANGAAPSVVPAPPPAPPVPPASGATVGAVSNVDPFKVLMDVIMLAMSQQKVKPDEIPKVLQHHGAPNLSDLNKMGHLIPSIKEHFEGIIAGTMAVPA